MRQLISGLCLLLTAGCGSAGDDGRGGQDTQATGQIPSQGDSLEEVAVRDFDQLWDYNDPAVTEQKFRDLIPEAEKSDDRTILPRLMTQIARTQGLQRKFDEAHATLDAVEAQLTHNDPVTRVRYLLERGRTFNSSKQPENARPLFLEAWELAKEAGADFHAVDAAHMMGIIEPAEEALAWNRTAMDYAEHSEDERARGWLGSLYNNIGWTYHDMGNYDEALAVFQKGLRWREGRGQEGPLRIAKWCVGRTLRSLNRLDEAYKMQSLLLAEHEAAGTNDGYVQEELGECLLAMGRGDEAKPYFARAYRLLSEDPWLMENDQDRMARLKELGGD